MNKLNALLETLTTSALPSAQKKKVGNCIFTNLKDPVPKLKQSNLVHELVCLNCDITYVGQTKQFFGDGIK